MGSSVIIPSEFSLFELQPPTPDDGDKLWEIMSVGFDIRDWLLTLTLKSRANVIQVVVENVESFRAQDEGNMLEYWSERTKENAQVASFYILGKSPYLDEMQGASVAGLTCQLTHFLVAGNNLCVDVITRGSPKVRIEQ
jgi:hypothetical protein